MLFVYKSGIKVSLHYGQTLTAQDIFTHFFDSMDHHRLTPLLVLILYYSVYNTYFMLEYRIYIYIYIYVYIHTGR